MRKVFCDLCRDEIVASSPLTSILITGAVLPSIKPVFSEQIFARNEVCMTCHAHIINFILDLERGE